MFSYQTVFLLVLSLSSACDVADAFSSAHISSTKRYYNPLTLTSSSLQAATFDSPPEIFLEEKSSEEEVPQSPGLREDNVFQCDESVRYWKEFQSEGNDGNLQRLVQVLREEGNTNNLSRAYWASHLLRTGYFSMNAALGSVMSDIHERFISSRQSNDGNSSNAKKDDTSSSIIFSNNNDMTNRLANSDIPSRLLLEAFRVYYQDYQYVKQGLLKFPWDALVRENNSIQWNHKQANPVFALQETANTIFESVAIFSRRNKQSSKGVFMAQNNNNMYPDYYLNDFHYQTDGWLSSDSAQRYEAATETLFLGRQDAMQRQTLIPILQSGTTPSTILEVAAGTGRFGTFVRDHFPTAQMTYTDLSPFYLEKAQENDNYWISQRGEQAMKESGFSNRKPEPATFVQSNAEDMPFEDNSFDVVTCVYLFHELPMEAQKRAAKEMVRVVKPGGMIVFTDSIQKGDRPPMDSQMGNFGKLNEPHYDNYIGTTYLPDLFEGCERGKKFVSSSTKTLSFIKKGEP